MFVFAEFVIFLLFPPKNSSITNLLFGVYSLREFFQRLEIWVLTREYNFVFSGVKAKDGSLILSLCIGLVSSGTSPLESLFGVALWIASRVDLHCGAATIPTIRRKKLVPELIARRQRYAVENAVLLPHTFVFSCSILQEEVISAFGDFLPACRCLRRSNSEVVFGLQIGLVVGFIDFLNIA